MYDKDGSGTVEVAELVDGLKKNRISGLEHEIEKLVAEFGSDKGSQLSFDDFVRLFQDVM